MPQTTPIHVLLAAGPGAPGAQALVDRALSEARAGRRLRFLLSAEGLSWAEEGLAQGWQLAEDVAVCSQQARSAGWSVSQAPAGVRWSSVATWLAEIGAAPAELWTALP